MVFSFLSYFYNNNLSFIFLISLGATIIIIMNIVVSVVVVVVVVVRVTDRREQYCKYLMKKC